MTENLIAYHLTSIFPLITIVFYVSFLVQTVASELRYPNATILRTWLHLNLPGLPSGSCRRSHTMPIRLDRTQVHKVPDVHCTGDARNMADAMSI